MKVIPMKNANEISCHRCERFPGDYEDTNNGFQIVSCEDGKTRCVNVDNGCAWFENNIFYGMTEVE